MAFVFGDFRLDSEAHELLHRGQRVNVQPKVFKLLLHLVSNGQRSVTNEELMAVVWPNETVSPASITSAVRSARRLLGDAGDSQTVIRTIRGHGYRFTESVTQVDEQTPQSDDVPEAPRALHAVETREQRDETNGVPFVGRAGVIAEFDRALAALASGRGSALSLVGEPGIGKTHILHQLRARAAHAGALVWFARCLEGEGAPPFWPLIQLVREAARALGAGGLRTLMGAGAADIAQAIPELRQWLPDLPEAPDIGARSARFRFYDSFATFFSRVSAEHALVLVFDDLQQADEPTARFLAFLREQQDRARLLLAVAMRPHTKRPQIGSVLADFSKPSASVCIELEGFTPAEVALYLEQRTGHAPPSQVVSQLHDQTAGNPLYLQKLVDRDGAARVESSAAVWEQLLTNSRGEGVRTAIERQLDTVGSACRGMLQAAAVLGRDFSLGLLLEVSHPRSVPDHREQLLRLLAEAESSGIVSNSRSPGHYRFTHALVRDALYDQIALHDRMHIHQRVGLALEAGGAAYNSALLAQMADHFMCAAPIHGNERALRYALRAAQDATEHLAYEEAAAHLDRALEMLSLGTPDRQRRLELLLAKGEALSRATLRAAMRGVLLEAASLARELNAVDGLIHAVTLLARPPEWGAPDATYVAWLREALSLLEPTDARRPELQALLAKSLSYARGGDEYARLALEALRGARSMPACEQRAEALLACHEALAGPQHLHTRLEVSEELSGLAHRLADPSLLMRAVTTKVWNAIERGNMPEVELAINMLETLAHGAREPFFGWSAKIYRAMSAIVRGQLTTARQLTDEARELGALIGQDLAEHTHGIQVATILIYQGRLVEAESLVRAFTVRFPARGGWRATLATLHAYFGHEAHARTVLQDLLANDLRALRAEPYILGAYAPAAQLCARVGDAAMAKQLYAAILPYEEHCGNVALGKATHGPMSRHLGLLAAGMGDLPRAKRHLVRAMERSEQMNAPPFLSLSWIGYAGVLIKEDTARSRREARELLMRALQLTTAKQLTGITKLANHLLGQLVSSAVSFPDPSAVDHKRIRL